MNCEQCLTEALFICHCSNAFLCELHFGQHLLTPGNHNHEKLIEELSHSEKLMLDGKLLTFIHSLQKLKQKIKHETGKIIKFIEEKANKHITQMNTLIKAYMNLMRTSRFKKEKIDAIRSLIGAELEMRNFSLSTAQHEIEKIYSDSIFSFVYDPNQIKQIKFDKFLQEHNGGFRCLAITSNGETLITGSEDTTVRFWDFKLKKQLACYIKHKSIVWCLALSSDNLFALSGSLDRSIILWSVRDKCYRSTYSGHSGAVYTVAFCNDCSFFVSGSTAKEIIMWKTDCLQYLVKIVTDNIIYCGFVSSKNVFYSGMGNFMKVWDLTSFKILFSINSHTLPIKCIKSTNDERFIITCSKDKLIKIWESNSKLLYTTLAGHTEEVNSVSITKDDKLIVSGSADFRVIIWSIDSKSMVSQFDFHDDYINSVITFDEIIISASRDSRLGIFDHSSNKFNCFLSKKPFKLGSQMMRDDLVAYGSRNDVVVCNINNKDSEVVLKGHDALVEVVCISTEKNYLISSSRDTRKNLIVWDLKNNSIKSMLHGHEDSVFCVDISNDEKKVISGDCLATVRLWDLQTTSQEFLFKGHKGHVYCVKFTNDQKLACSAGSDLMIFIWDIDRKLLYASLSGHSQVIWKVLVTSDDKFIVSSDCHTGIMIWNISERKRENTFRRLSESKQWLQRYQDLEFEFMKYLI